MERLVDIKVNGEKINDVKKYTVAVSGYLADGGDGFNVFTEGRVVNADLPFQDALYGQFEEARNINQPTINRQIDISKR
jgi:2',3'-cyclic-nucleotide 2'-phosphodiesterase (5'-nucleotidase family)